MACLISALLEGTLKIIRGGKFREEGKKSHGLVFFPLTPHFLTTSHICYRINKSYYSKL